MKKFALFILLLIVIGAAAGWWFYRGVDRPFKGYDAAEQFVDIPPGSRSVAIARSLADAGVVRDVNSFKLALWISGSARRLQAGEYRFDHPMSARQVAEKIARGDVYVRPITFPEGLTIRQMAELYEGKGFGDAKTFIAAASHAELVHDIDPTAKDLEGYLFPDTYALPRRATADQLVARMVAGFMKALTPDIVDAASARGLSVRRLVTLASIVEKETGNKEERPLVAAVYSNRLQIGMGLQCDPTVIYALERAGRYDGNLRREDLHFDSPYNTYRYAGLPPGPIASPGRASLQAAASPANVSYLYFVSRNDGSHVFATTLEEHNRNVQQYQVKYFRDQRRGSGL
ncbi:MAG TPA: endolytic transglycosylase MltG [Vicinamibacterales bacterium]|nr:endolytic transglycosylase MltG [Vicinamibacterales bacterium]